jgi:hypothetical protein
LENISVPASVQKHLSEGEEVLGKLSGKGADYYATSKRLLRFTDESHYQPVEYSALSVNSVSLGTPVTIFRVAMVVVGLIIIAFGLLFLSVADEAEAPGFPGGSFGLVVFFWILGLGCAFIGASVRSSYYQIRAPGIAEGDKQWQIGSPLRWARSADKFVEILKQRSAGH